MPPPRAYGTGIMFAGTRAARHPPPGPWPAIRTSDRPPNKRIMAHPFPGRATGGIEPRPQAQVNALGPDSIPADRHFVTVRNLSCVPPRLYAPTRRRHNPRHAPIPSPRRDPAVPPRGGSAPGRRTAVFRDPRFRRRVRRDSWTSTRSPGRIIWRCISSRAPAADHGLDPGRTDRTQQARAWAACWSWLIERALITQRPGPNDRRQRLLTLTPAGAALEKTLSDRQRTRIRARLSRCRRRRRRRFPQGAAGPGRLAAGSPPVRAPDRCGGGRADDPDRRRAVDRRSQPAPADRGRRQPACARC